MVFPDQQSALIHRANRGQSHVVQPWLEGRATSLSLLCCDGQARLLACNRQKVRVSEGQVILGGIEVNGERERAEELAPLSHRIAAAIPELWGYVGVDLLLTVDGPIVLEINPRLTTSWCGLRQALGINPAQWLVELTRSGALPATPSPRSGGTCYLDLEPTGVR